MAHRILHVATAAAVVVLLVFVGTSAVPWFLGNSACKGPPLSMGQLRHAGGRVAPGTIPLSDVRVTDTFSSRDHRNFARQMSSDELSQTDAGESRIFASSDGRVIVVVSYVNGDVEVNAGMAGNGKFHNPVQMVVLDAATGSFLSGATFYGPCVRG